MIEDELATECAMLAQRLLERAERLGVTLGCAESCTGGMIASQLTAISGSSASFVGGVVSYWVSVKEQLLGVDAELVSTHGVVSERCAEAMAQGARRALGCDYAVSTTGIAGPTGAEPGKPVGTVCYGVATPSGVTSFRTCEGSSRDDVRMRAVRNALEALCEALG